jgi:Bacterial CdiA-CT RNAse A domain
VQANSIKTLESTGSRGRGLTDLTVRCRVPGLISRWIRSAVLLFPLLFLVGIGFGVGHAAEVGKAGSGSGGGKVQIAGIPGGSLEAHERAGGHLLERHVGKTAEDLRERLQRDTRISAASSFTDKKSAEEAVVATIAANQKKITGWLKGDEDRLVISYSGRKVIGISMGRGSNRARDAMDVRLVLVRDKRFAGGWRILTGYPET